MVDFIVEFVVVSGRLHFLTPNRDEILIVAVYVCVELREPSLCDGGAETHDREWLYERYQFPRFGVQSYVALLPLAKRFLGDVSCSVCSRFEV